MTGWPVLPAAAAPIEGQIKNYLGIWIFCLFFCSPFWPRLGQGGRQQGPWRGCRPSTRR